MKKFSILFLIFLLATCVHQITESNIIGFWEGPHPVSPIKKFYIHFEKSGDTLIAKGYWAENNFYQSHFEVENPRLKEDSIRFFIPLWNCWYSGVVSNNEYICGGFFCEGEPFDTVNLVRNDKIADFLVNSKPGCKNPGYQYQYTIPPSLDDEIETSGFLSMGDSMFIYSILPEIINGDFGRLNSFLLFKNEKLICEEYFFGYTRNDLHYIESCTKSVTSLLIGIAKDKSLITDIDEPLFNIFPEYPVLKKANYRDITIKYLLTMTSGYDPQNEELFRSDDRIDFALKRKLINKPGSTFNYDGGNTEILGAILKLKTGEFGDSFAEEYLFKPITIQNYSWETYGQKGFPCMAGSLQLLPREMLKIGILVLNKGKFNNQQIVSEQWIHESTSIKTSTNIPGDDYSYQWWNLHLTSNGKTYETTWANGLGSQFIYIIPEIDVVIVTTGYNYENDSWAITGGIKKYLYLLDAENKF